MNAASRERTCEALNELYRHESRSLLPRLAESSMFVAWADAAELSLVQRMIREEREHLQWLIGAIQREEGSVYPASADVTTANLHYLNLGAILPRVIQDVEKLYALYESALRDPSLKPEVREVLSRIGARHGRHLESLRGLHAQAAAAPAR